MLFAGLQLPEVSSYACCACMLQLILMLNPHMFRRALRRARVVGHQQATAMQQAFGSLLKHSVSTCRSWMWDVALETMLFSWLVRDTKSLPWTCLSMPSTGAVFLHTYSRGV